MKKLAITILSALSLAAFSMPTPAHSGEHSNTIIKQLENMQVVVDIHTMADHMKMMKTMNVNMKHDMNSSHSIYVTLKDQKQLIKNAIVKIKVIGPDKKTIGLDSGTSTMPMAGKGMYHYVANFKMDKKGKYQIMLLFKVKDKKHQTNMVWENHG